LLDYLRQRFTRVTSSVALIPQVDGLRALALLLVMGHHVFAIYLMQTHRLGTQLLPRDWDAIAPRSALVNWGLHLAFGVPIFFVISGFVLALPFARSIFSRKPFPSTGLYLLRRLIRLEPPYLISMTFLFAIIVAPWQGPRWHAIVMWKIFAPHYFASLAYLHAQIFDGPSWINGNAWTLEIEIQFYLLMPLLAQLFRVRSAGVRRGLWVGLTVLAALLSEYWPPLSHNLKLKNSLAGHMEFFLAGVLLADLYLNLPRGLRWSPRVGDVWALGSAAFLVYVLHWRASLAWLEALTVLVFFLACFRGRWAGWLFSRAWLTIPGTMCYTIYLYHFFVIQQVMPWAVRVFPPVHALWLDCTVQMVAMLPPVLLVSAVLYLAFERPFVVLSHVATRRWRAGSGAVTGLSAGGV
jgi:peptidoglycan/LPS O-acetylase OafA/YrhL